MISNFDNIVFDLGGVVVDIDRESCVKAFEKLGLSNADELLDSYCQKGVFLDIEEGRMTAAEFYDLIGGMCSEGVTAKDIEVAFCEFITGLPVSRLQALRELRKSKKVYALSNTNVILYNTVIDSLFRQEGLTINDYFDGVVTSYADRSCKPDSHIFEALLSRYSLDGSRSLFLDDSIANVEVAKRCGMEAVLVPKGVEFIDMLDIKL